MGRWKERAVTFGVHMRKRAIALLLPIIIIPFIPASTAGETNLVSVRVSDGARSAIASLSLKGGVYSVVDRDALEDLYCDIAKALGTATHANSQREEHARIAQQVAEESKTVEARAAALEIARRIRNVQERDR